MAMVLLSIAVMLQQAGRIHDETKAAMGLHEAVEKARHGSAKELQATGSAAQEHLGRLMFFPDCDLAIKEKRTEDIRRRQRGENGKERLRREGSGRRHFCARLL